MERLKLKDLLLDEIDISILNVRKSNLEEGIEELANSIKEIGVQQPIVVFQRGNRYELLIGQRRYLACKKLNLKNIPALITTVKNETDAIIKSFSENIHRLELEYRDKMQVATMLLKKLGSADKVARYLGVNPQTVRKWLGYKDLSEDIKEMVDEGKLSATTALRIWRNIPNEKKAVEIAKKVKEIPRSEDRTSMIDIARENPRKSFEEIVKITKERSITEKIILHVTQRVYKALIQASKEYQSNKEDVAKEALENWLKKKGFIK